MEKNSIQFTVIIYMYIYSLLEMFLMIRLKVGAWVGTITKKKKNSPKYYEWMAKQKVIVAEIRNCFHKQNSFYVQTNKQKQKRKISEGQQ